ncbi:type II toxin-antitoxin system VapC family toxin [uncultured Jannaschia sp.]|uniref:type II toxin-antitoxin system VapC family toxin n=1 Tax=uncultured Jannaschia sp. TaxID=293347 RepID=UPI002621D548|nr:type II toxin-antitoxin system VapC family toxin [uncultured Jannaschia sp.]
MLDTNVLIHAMRGADDILIERMEACLAGELVISAITLGELEHGWRAGHGDREAARPFLALVPVLPFDAKAAEGFGAVMAGLSKPKRRTYDRQIAGHALSLGLVVVTSDASGFAGIAGLQVEDWKARSDG